jgi:protocatechuate 3,4-dioxygenase beta subunit
MRLVSRRTLSMAWLSALGLSATAWFCSSLAQPAELPSSPACTPPAQATPGQTEGPYYTRNPPRRHTLVQDQRQGSRTEKKIVLVGYVLTRNCRPVSGALVDVWQANAAGAYDNAGFNLRGYELTDEQGRYWFETVVPGEYPGRTPHIHVKVQGPGGRLLTTQLYFPNERRNARDGIFNPALLVKITQAADARSDEPALVGRFDFILDAP